MPETDLRRRRRNRKALNVRRLVHVAHSAPHGVPDQAVLEFGSVSGLSGMEGRTAVVTVTHADLARVLGVIPAGEIPKNVSGAMTDVRRWLATGHEPPDTAPCAATQAYGAAGCT